MSRLHVRQTRTRRNSDVVDVGSQPADPLEQEAFVEAARRTDGEVIAVLIREADLELRMLPDAHDGECVLLELLACPGQNSA